MYIRMKLSKTVLSIESNFKVNKPQCHVEREREREREGEGVGEEHSETKALLVEHTVGLIVKLTSIFLH